MFAFRLALALGEPHPDHLYAKLTSRQVTEWQAYYSLEPFGEDMAWLRNAIIATLLVNTHRGKRGRAAKPEDFMPRKPKPPQTPEEMKQALMTTFTAMKKQGRAIRKKRKPNG